MGEPESLFLIAGSGEYPGLVAREARRAGVGRIVLATFEGETAQETIGAADEVFPMRVGQLGKLLDAAKKSGCPRAMMAGQLAPSNLFNLRPDFRALALLARLPRRNAETLFGAVAAELEKIGIELLPGNAYLDDHVATDGLLAGRKLKPRQVEDLQFGFSIAKEVSRMDIGQTVVVKNGTVLAVEGFEGTDACLRRGGELGRGDATMVKVSKPGQDLRFDIPVIGTKTLETAKSAGISRIGIEAGKTLLLDKPKVCSHADAIGISLFGLSS